LGTVTIVIKSVAQFFVWEAGGDRTSDFRPVFAAFIYTDSLACPNAYETDITAPIETFIGFSVAIVIDEITELAGGFSCRANGGVILARTNQSTTA
tara:strand:+ start:575 stop:862 length:288 start_codon:yes stop_codon:yes gene_type:complete